MKRLVILIAFLILAAPVFGQAEDSSAVLSIDVGDVVYSPLLMPPLAAARWYRGGDIGWYWGFRAELRMIPFPTAQSEAPEDTMRRFLTLYPEASLCLGLYARLLRGFEAAVELDLGGDAYLEWGERTNTVRGTSESAFVWALTPLAWLRPSLLFRPGALFPRRILARLGVEASCVIGLGDPTFIYERWRWEIALVWTFGDRADLQRRP